MLTVLIAVSLTPILALPLAASATTTPIHPPVPGAHNPACRIVDKAVPRATRRRIVRACLRDVRDERAVILGLHTAMAGDISIVNDNRGELQIRGYAREVLAHPSALGWIEAAREGAAAYAPVIHTGGLWTTPEKLVRYHAGLMREGARNGPDFPFQFLALLAMAVLTVRKLRQAG